MSHGSERVRKYRKRHKKTTLALKKTTLRRLCKAQKNLREPTHETTLNRLLEIYEKISGRKPKNDIQKNTVL